MGRRKGFPALGLDIASFMASCSFKSLGSVLPVLPRPNGLQGFLDPVGFAVGLAVGLGLGVEFVEGKTVEILEHLKGKAEI